MFLKNMQTICNGRKTYEENIQTKKYTQCLFLVNENDYETFLDFIQKAKSFNVQLKIKKKSYYI